METPSVSTVASKGYENEGISMTDVKKPGLKKIPPYWYPYTTMAKGRWLGREILEVVSTEFRDRSMEFYVSHVPPIRKGRVVMVLGQINSSCHIIEVLSPEPVH
ncbi:hypothetical protein C8Q78DRAFT_1040892 [Trametes maxima]|nr:hypothetical protein C8Q78DRAFT_1040892 [Trametes maxima]